jgi:hypothetical protein
MAMGKVVSGWFLFWQAGIAREKLDALTQKAGIVGSDQAAVSGLAKTSRDAAFYLGKIASAQYFIRNVLPEVDAAVKAMKSEDMSVVEIPEESFAS